MIEDLLFVFLVKAASAYGISYIYFLYILYNITLYIMCPSAGLPQSHCGDSREDTLLL